MRFDDDLAGGVTLIRPALQSPNYDPGKAGWKVGVDGSAEFNDAVVRGGISVGGVSLYYNGTPGPGRLIMAVSGQAGTDAYGNGYPAGISVFGPDGRITLSTAATAATWTSASGSRVILEADEFTASTQYQPADTAGVTWQPGVISAILTSRLGVNTPSVAITSPHARGTAGPAEIRLHGSGPSNGSANEVVIDTQSTVMTGDTKCEGRLTAGNILSGRLTVTPVANQWTDNINVVFSRPFATKPEVMVTPSSSAPAAGGSTSLSWATSGVTATGFTLRVLRGSATAMEFSWFAMATT